MASRFASEPKNPVQGYVVREATTATKVAIPIRELPVSVQVSPKQVLRDQNITQVQNALENVSGVTSNNNDDAGYNFNIRGFQSHEHVSKQSPHGAFVSIRRISSGSRS